MKNYLTKYNLLEACFVLFGFSFSHSEKILHSVSIDEIKKAYRKKAKIFHPDSAGHKNFATAFNNLQNAYNLLLDYKKSKIISKTAKPETHSYAKVKDFYYSGQIPKRQLRFGEYLFYIKVISWRMLIKAIINQYHNRPKLGEICRSLNYLTHEEIKLIIKNIKLGEMFGNAALRLKLLTPYQHLLALGNQKIHNRPIGRYFVEIGLLSEKKLEEYIKKHKEHNLNLKKKH